jgi:hypothetical protein
LLGEYFYYLPHAPFDAGFNYWQLHLNRIGINWPAVIGQLWSLAYDELTCIALYLSAVGHSPLAKLYEDSVWLVFVGN